MPNECNFCKELKNLLKDNAPRLLGYKAEYKAAIQRICYLLDDPYATQNYGGYELNFCPSCGRELKENENG